MKCQICHHPCVPDLPGREPYVLEIYKDEEVIVCRICRDEWNAKLEKAKSEKAKKKVILDFLKKSSLAILIVVLFVFCAKAFGQEPAMSCSIHPAGDTVICQALNADAFDIQWMTIAYGKPQYFAFGREVRLPATHKFWTLFVMSLHKDGEIVKQSAHWFRIRGGKVEGKPYTKGIDPNKDIPEDKNYRRACIVSILGNEGRVFLEPVLIVGEDDNFYWVFKDGYDKSLNIPKERVLLAGRTGLFKAQDGQVRKCTCPMG